MKLNSIIMLGTFATLIVAFWNRNNLPGEIPLLPAIDSEPVQRRVAESPFDVTWKDLDYRIEPEYDYELTGLIVSFRHQDGNSRMHRMTNDKLNMLDLCVIWGDTAKNPRLNAIDFWNGVFTCNVQTRDQAAWDAFDMDQLSNNHLLSADSEVRDAVRSIRIGDQIRVRGRLASYVSPGGARRGTSVTRTDTGNGACETIFVEQFEILKRGVSYWRYLMYLALTMFLLSLLVHFISPHKVAR